MLSPMAKKPTTPRWRVQLRELKSLPAMTLERLAGELGISTATVWRLLYSQDKDPKLKDYLAIQRLHADGFGHE